MKKHIQNKIFEIISEVILKDNLQAYVIGGYVRDAILQRNSKDIDVVVVGSGIKLAKAVKVLVDDKAKYTDWNERADIKAELKMDLIILLAEHDYPPITKDEVFKEIFEQAENFKKNR